MAPKKGRAETPQQDIPPEPEGPQEEEEEGPGRVAVSFEVLGITDLPCELETRVHVSGLCRENRSENAESSANPSSYTFEKTKFVRSLNQAVYDDFVSREIIFKVFDCAEGGGIIGQASMSLLPLIHERSEVSAELELVLTEPYRAKWFPEPDPPPVPEKGAKGAPPPSPPPAATPEPASEEPPFVPPTTKIRVTVSVPGVFGPPEDRESWTTITLSVDGVFALPERLTALADTPESTPMRFHGCFLGENLGDCALLPPAEIDPNAAPPDSASGKRPATGGKDAPPAQPVDPPDAEEPAEVEPEMGTPEWRAKRQRFAASLAFKDATKVVLYRGADFMRDMRFMLNHVGGVWFYLTLEEKPSVDTKKPNPPELGMLAHHFTGRAWLDLRALIKPGGRSVAAGCTLTNRHPVAEEAANEPTLQSCGTFVCLALELSHSVAPEVRPESRIAVSQLVPSHENVQKFPSSKVAAEGYVQAVERCFDVVRRDTAGGVTGGVPGAVDLLRHTGSYEVTKEDLRGAVVAIFRERLRKDTSIVPGCALTGDAREKFFSETYAHLKREMARVLEEIRDQAEANQVSLPSPPLSESPTMGASQVMGGTMGGTMRRTSNARDDSGEPTPSVSPNGGMVDPVAAALAESAAARRARGALAAAADTSARCARLASEAEMVGNWARAAKLFQSRLVIDENARSPEVWIEYAKFCMRSGGRQAAAEEALRQAVVLLAEDGAQSVPGASAAEVDLMLAGILLDRGRHAEAAHVFRTRHKTDLTDPMHNLLLGLAIYLSGEEEEWRPLLAAVAKPHEWFEGLPDDKAVADKMRLFAATDKSVPDVQPYADCLGKLLEFGLPHLVFTFLDQCRTLPKECLRQEPLALVDARASYLDRDYSAAVARLEPLLASGAGASREAWRVAGECHFQLQDFEKAMQELQYALSFEQKFEDPEIYIRLGHVYLLKKRWKQARDSFLRSISFEPTAEAWSGVGYAEFRSEELQSCYEALCEANLLDNERSDVWAQLSLVHLRLENWELADRCLRRSLACGPETDELLLELAAELGRREKFPELAEVAARRALQVRDSGSGHAALADALERQGQAEAGVLEAQVAIGLFTDQPEARRAVFDRALRWCEDVQDPALTESLHAVQKLADQKHAGST